MDTHEERKHLAAHCDPVKCIGHDNSTSQSHWFLHFLLRVQFLPSHIFVLAHPCSFLPICSSLTSVKRTMNSCGYFISRAPLALQITLANSVCTHAILPYAGTVFFFARTYKRWSETFRGKFNFPCRLLKDWSV